MTMQLTPSAPTTTRPTYDVRIDGELMGEVKPYQHDQWHASIKVQFRSGFSSYALIQGFGTTPELAVEDAFKEGVQEHELSLAAIKDVYGKLMRVKAE